MKKYQVRIDILVNATSELEIESIVSNALDINLIKEYNIVEYEELEENEESC